MCRATVCAEGQHPAHRLGMSSLRSIPAAACHSGSRTNTSAHAWPLAVHVGDRIGTARHQLAAALVVGIYLQGRLRVSSGLIESTHRTVQGRVRESAPLVTPRPTRGKGVWGRRRMFIIFDLLPTIVLLPDAADYAPPASSTITSRTFSSSPMESWCIGLTLATMTTR